MFDSDTKRDIKCDSVLSLSKVNQTQAIVRKKSAIFDGVYNGKWQEPRQGLTYPISVTFWLFIVPLTFVRFSWKGCKNQRAQ